MAFNWRKWWNSESLHTRKEFIRHVNEDVIPNLDVKRKKVKMSMAKRRWEKLPQIVRRLIVIGEDFVE